MGFTSFILLILSMAIVSFGVEVNVIHEWKYADFEWRSQEQKKEALRSGSYNPLMCLFEDTSKADDGRLFVTVTNIYGAGSPATLTTVTNKIGPGGPILRPYPDWSWYNSNWYNSKCMCDGIVNVYRTNIQCNHLIVLDNGKIGQFDQVCNPKLLIFDLKDDTLVKSIYLPLDFATNQTGSGLMITPLVYAPGDCKQFLNKMIVFMTDTEGSGLVVYESSTKRMCRVESDYMKPVNTFFSVAKQNFTHEGGIFSITIVNDELYYVPISGKGIYKIKIEALLKCPNKEEANKQSKLVTKLSSQTAVITSTKNSIFYSNYREMSILGMNVCAKFNKIAVEIAQDNEKFQVISSMKVSNYWNRMICMSNRYQHFALHTLNLGVTNFRYFEIKLPEIKKIID
ncbi:PREDICTED: major royal jelly protein 3-like [Trachymyrmex septentrionalis]|uniref:major royal jelly protein 3-like n=1 Tax=Trachymyrmex septentrionalis TaxID=34720 RepID=UPI00084F725B|nr:PREDICTED: major royal jelly protein 3-like [Trachymyrmex septentrionalis]